MAFAVTFVWSTGFRYLRALARVHDSSNAILFRVPPSSSSTTSACKRLPFLFLFVVVVLSGTGFISGFTTGSDSLSLFLRGDELLSGPVRGE